MNGSQIVSETWGNHLAIYLYDESGAPIGLQYRNSTYDKYVFDTYYFEKNLQGDVVAVYDAEGNRIGSYTYDAWGNVTVSYASGATTAEKRIVRNYNPFRYRGYYYDIETGLYYLQSRYYDPAMGRFVNADGYVSTGTGLIGYNRYVYCNNNPVNMQDAAGNWPRWITATVAVVALAVAVVAVAVPALGPAIATKALVVSIASAGAYVLQSLHYDDRAARNSDLPKTEEEAVQKEWCGPKAEIKGPSAACHQFTSEDNSNVKYVSPDGKREVIFNAQGDIVLDSRDVGTYNYCPSGNILESAGHFVVDVFPWLIFGNADDDPGPALNWIIELFE